MSGKLYLVPTPIGNLADITYRAVQVLMEVDIILAEDTRTSKKLLDHYDITTPMMSHHAHNEHATYEKIMNEITAGKSFALISDAGTPGISDPGFLLLRACVENNLSVEVLPGATAFVPALILSALPNHQFIFVGFLPVKKGRQTQLKKLKEEERTMIFYESPHKITKTLKDLIGVFGSERKASLSRELTKKFEETLRAPLSDLLEISEKRNLKGEMVLVVEGKSE